MEGFWRVRRSAIFRSRLVASKLAWIYNWSGISSMQVSKWGNSLAVRLPAVVVEALDLKEGDEIEISIAGIRDFKVGRDSSKEAFPPDFQFNREEIVERSAVLRYQHHPVRFPPGRTAWA